jgi:hypothetical protein
MIHPTTSQRTWRFPRLILTDHLTLLLVIWTVAITITILTVIVVAQVRDIVISGWEAFSGLAPWYIAVIGGYLFYQVVPVFVAHGRTRRDAGIETATCLGIVTIAAAVLIVVGYLIEYVVYGIAGWPREIPDDHAFTSHLDVARIFIEYWLAFLVWSTAGAFVGAATYRSKDIGWFSLIPAMLLVSLAGIGTAPGAAPAEILAGWWFSVDNASLALAAGITVVCVGAALAMTWAVVRDVPLRNR